MNPAPIELARLGLDREHFIRADAKSWRGPCPRCGGHRRLLIFTDHPFPKWNAQCEACGLKAWADQLEPAVRAPVDAATRQDWADRNRREAEAAAAYRREKLAEFSKADLWAELCERMTAEHRATWETWGVPAEWQNYLELGYHPSKPYLGEDGEHHTSPAFTIPYFHTGREFMTLQYRLFNPPTPTDRYRFEKGLGTAYYQVDHDAAIGEQAIVCEGAKKAMVLHIHGGQKELTVLAIPSKGNFAGVVDAVKDCARVYVCLDPDAGMQAHKLAAAVGLAARVVDLPSKVDDAIVSYGLTPALLADALRYARPA